MAVIDFEEDEEFDARFPREFRELSPLHYTPIAVARHVASLLGAERPRVVLDVGAGIGKFCLVAAAERPNVTFVGIELRKEAVEVAAFLAAEQRLPNACFLQGDAFDLDWASYDAFYFYNPFGEYFGENPGLFRRNIRLTLERLAAARKGTLVITYHGLGADLPSGYECLDLTRIGSDAVELWFQTRPASA